MKLIKLTQGYYTKVDDEDYEWLNKFKWQVDIKTKDRMYARTTTPQPKSISMHRLILGLTGLKIWTDHKDRDGLNNQRSNIRACTPSQNNWNKRKHPNAKGSRYIGVRKEWNKFSSTIVHHGNSYYLGAFKTERRAAIEYDKHAIILHGEFANLNILKVKK